MTQICGATHPVSGETCEKSALLTEHKGNHLGGGVAWPDPERIELLTRDIRKPSKRPGKNRAGSVISQFLGSKDEWAEDAYATLVEWLRANDSDFTTAQQFWPLLVAPADKRSLSIVVQRLLREKKIEEVGSTRLRGTYLTQDGVPFEENKLVPIYRSRIAGQPQGQS